MYLLYLIALIPVAIGAALFLFTHKVAWVEWVGGSLLAFLVAVMCHGITVYTMTADVETWSGELNRTIHYPEWVEQYHVIHHTYNSKGQITGTYTTTHYRTHPEYWWCGSNIDTGYDIERPFYDKVMTAFGGQIETSVPYKSGFYSGDRNIYTTFNRTGYVFPVTKQVSFENRIKACPSLFSFAKVPAAVDKRLFGYPVNGDPFRSDRLLGCAANVIDPEKFDIMNAKLGPSKLVNVIMVGFSGEEPDIAEWQRAKWVGGKKNDLVICYGADKVPGKAKWCRVFGWTESETVKRKLETLVVNSCVGNGMLEPVSSEIREHYKLKDWSKFDYITIEPNTAVIVWMLVAMVLTQAGFYIFALVNDINNFEDLMEAIRTYRNS